MNFNKSCHSPGLLVLVCEVGMAIPTSWGDCGDCVRHRGFLEGVPYSGVGVSSPQGAQFLLHSRDFSGPTASRGVEVICLLIRKCPEFSFPPALGIPRPERKRQDFRGRGLSVTPALLTPFTPSWAQGTRPFASLDNDSRSTEIVDKLTLGLHPIPPFSHRHLPPSPPGSSSQLLWPPDRHHLPSAGG